MKNQQVQSSVLRGPAPWGGDLSNRHRGRQHGTPPHKQRALWRRAPGEHTSCLPLSCTAGNWAEGTPLNLERALRVGDELGGHIVTGHVDGVGRVVEIMPEGDSIRVVIEAPAALAPYVAAKGSIALDGVSLTVNEVTDLPGGDVRFGVNIIPHTSEMTTFRALAPGHRLNMEIDVLARYLGRMERLRRAG